MTTPTDKERIATLEAEVGRLKQQAKPEPEPPVSFWMWASAQRAENRRNERR